MALPRGGAPGHDFVRVRPDPHRPAPGRPSPRSTLMSRYVAPLGFTLAAVWVAVLFVLAGGGH
ncbi:MULTISPECIES: hypothetical protein [Micromonospora]|uniref:Uncharacterized protein n=1 Tax=Micromonospora tulbaghiae TaxID=479978 RepID=A0A386WDT6_9ACTN|nr:hypothetical protein [Micromonospora tulbaghiae]AYF26536.1 hypothetical protein CSH63_03425 [Micromonospora tulbaghiae]NED58149.1 hypothetical protein [Micromonospora aurantiaca]